MTSPCVSWRSSETARLTATEYEWVQHQEIARLVGIDEEKIGAVERGEIASGLLRYIERRESLPRTATLKVIRSELTSTTARVVDMVERERRVRGS